MSLHKLTAGTGFEYLTRQGAAQDATDKGGVGLATYYTQSGETPGRWVGTGLAGLGEIAVGDLVTPEQMRHLFGPVTTRTPRRSWPRAGPAYRDRAHGSDAAVSIGMLPWEVHARMSSSRMSLRGCGPWTHSRRSANSSRCVATSC